MRRLRVGTWLATIATVVTILGGLIGILQQAKVVRPFVSAVVSWIAGPPWLPWALTAITVAIAAAWGFVIVRRGRHSLVTESHEQRERLSEIPQRETAIRGLLDGLVERDRDCYFVYSATGVERFVNQDGKPITYPFNPDELQVTAIPDAQGIAMVHSMLNLAGKQDRLHIVTSRTFQPQFWDGNVILIGSPNANRRTKDALRRLEVPYRFNEDVSAIVSVAKPEVHWPEVPTQLADLDFAILVKLVRVTAGVSCVYLVLAGIGAIGTLSACYYLDRNVAALWEEFGSSPFGLVLRTDRGLGFTSVDVVESSRMAVV